MKRAISLLVVLTMLLTSMAFAEGAAWQSGDYTGEAAGFGGNVSVALTIEDGKITNVTATGADESSPALGNDLTLLAEQILEAQSAEIDGVAGATITSGAVRDAAAAALAQAGGEATEQTQIADGVYTATRESFQLEHVTVNVTITDGKIADVEIAEITDHPTTITDTPCAQIPAAIVEHQSYNVDGVTGATFTSNSIKNAVRDCLDQAGGSEAFSAPVVKPEIVKGEDVETDILVVGGGAAGMSAAMEAS